ncbi:MAG: hypothetical protein JNM58_09345 [Xanthomonadaceae bacterium]|nr:hypothetical protein [Xanthomonadaceae bacterium]
MRRAAALPFAFCLLVASTASAHDTLPTKWCPLGTQPVVTGRFAFSERQLVEYRASRLADASVLGSTCNTLKTCGIIDEWYWANQMAHESAMGSQLRSSAQASVSESPMPVVTSPSTFNLNQDVKPANGIADHHDQYRFSQGLAGDYVVCRATRTALPSELPLDLR